MHLLKIFDETVGEGEYNSISLHFCKLWQDLFFLLQSLDVRASENLSDSQISTQITSFLMFFLFNPPETGMF